MDKFIEFLNANNIKYTDDMLNKLELYYNFLVEYNQKVNLTAITDKNDVYKKHFADSLLGLEYISNNSILCDIGTGAGFPGVVLKIFNPSIKLYLVDSLNKRIVFLNELINLLKLENVTIIHARAEDISFKQKYLNKFDYVVARAVANLNTLLEYCLPYVKIGGNFISYKSNDIDNELKNVDKVISILGGNGYCIKEKKLDDTTNRCLIIINKAKNTVNKYPRGQNKPRLNPLM